MAREVLRLIREVHKPVNKKLLDNRVAGAKSRAIKKGLQGKDSAFELSTEYLMNLYVFQRGLCYLTKRKLYFTKKHKDVISLDRRDPQYSYRRFNTAFTTHRTNKAKGDMTEEEYLREIDDTYNRTHV